MVCNKNNRKSLSFCKQTRMFGNFSDGWESINRTCNRWGWWGQVLVCPPTWSVMQYSNRAPCKVLFKSWITGSFLCVFPRLKNLKLKPLCVFLALLSHFLKILDGSEFLNCTGFSWFCIRDTRGRRKLGSHWKTDVGGRKRKTVLCWFVTLREVFSPTGFFLLFCDSSNYFRCSFF